MVTGLEKQIDFLVVSLQRNAVVRSFLAIQKLSSLTLQKIFAGATHLHDRRNT